MLWRIFYGTLRTILGVVLLKVINIPFSDLLYKIMSNELGGNPAGILFSITNSFLQIHPFTVTYFIAAYLIFWGLLDVILSINLLRHNIWAFPISLYLIGFFILYEFYRFFHTYSIILLGIILIDIIIFWLINIEYRKTKKPVFPDGV